MRKVLLFLVFVSIIAVLLMPATAMAEPGDTGISGDFEWVELEGGTAEIIGYVGSGGSVTVPGNIGPATLRVVGIANSAFQGEDLITSVSLPSSCEFIAPLCIRGLQQFD